MAGRVIRKQLEIDSFTNKEFDMNQQHEDRLCLSCLATVSEFDAECASCGTEFAGSGHFSMIAGEGPSALFMEMFKDRWAAECASAR